MHKFMPAREEAKPIQVIHDLDVLSSQDIGFKYKDKIYKLGTLTVAAWMKLIPAYAKVTELQKKLAQGESVEILDVIDGYYEITSALIPDLKYAEIRAMEFGELNAILGLIRRKFEGDPTLAQEAQKKNPQIPRVKPSYFKSFLKLLLSPISTIFRTKKS